ncbi:MAG: MFS transporter [Actinomycetota bacterium]|nr:MFS transporter [Actinomycetota bacterium]
MIVVWLAFLAVLTDGFDTAILALLVPHLAEEWVLPPAAFTYPLVLTNLGVVCGYVSCGFLARKIGSKNLLVLGVLVFALATIASAATLHLESMSILSVTRAITGLGLGIVLPTAVVVGTRSGPVAKKQSIAVFVTMGLITGATVAGFSGAVLIRSLGTDGTLWLAGLVPLVLGALMWRLIPTVSVPIPTSGAARGSAVVAILGRELRSSTVVLWVATFLVFVASYTLKSWLPTLFADYGLPKDTAGLGLAFFSLGGVAGGLVLMPLSARFSAVRSLVVMSLVGAASVCGVALLPTGTALLMIMTLVAGLGITACSIGQTAIAVGLYEDSLRATGVGWSAAAGRIGSIVGPAIAGILLGLNWPAQDIVLLLAAPILVTTVCWLWLARQARRTKAAVPAADIAATATR